MLAKIFEKAINRVGRYYFPVYAWQQKREGYQNPKPNSHYPDFFAASGEKLAVYPILEELAQNGVVAIPNFLSAAYVDSVREECLRIHQESEREHERKQGLNHTTELFNNTFNFEKNPIDGVSRLYHVEKRAPAVNEFSQHPFLNFIAQEYYRRPVYLETTIFQKNIPTPEGTRGWHIDSWLNQFKAFLYLTDVTSENGPFTYLLGSHKNEGFLLKKTYRSMRGEESTDISEALVKQSGLTVKKCTGTRGTLLLADTKGIYHGGSLASGSRSALVNYYYLNRIPTYQ